MISRVLEDDCWVINSVLVPWYDNFVFNPLLAIAAIWLFIFLSIIIVLQNSHSGLDTHVLR